MKNFFLFKFEQNENIFKHLPVPTDPSCSSLNIKDDINTSYIPYTYGEFYRIRNEEVRLGLWLNEPSVN